MIGINRSSDTRLLELGGGSNPNVIPKCLGGQDTHIDARMCTNSEGKQCVDIAHNLSQFPWPVKDNEFDGVICIFCLEHISYVKTLSFLKESYRVIKPGSKVVYVIPNTEAQCKWILANPDGWDGKSFFEAASENLFGSQDSSVKAQEVSDGNFHSAYFNPLVVNKLFEDAGFENIVVQPYGTRETDLCIQAVKPIINAPVAQMPQEQLISNQQVGADSNLGQVNGPMANSPVLQYDGPNKPDLTSEQRAKLFDRNYFDKYPGSRLGFYWDMPHHQVTFQKVMEKKPESVLELGSGRGYILKRLEDVGIKTLGIDISKHCNLTKVSSRVFEYDATKGIPFVELDNSYDICFTNSFLEYVPEELLPIVIKEMERICKRGMHGINFVNQVQYPDVMQCTLRTKEWWQNILPKDHEVYSVQELEQGQLTDDYLNGDGRTKLSLGTAWTMAHHGWQNLDMIDAAGFASGYRYNYKQLDIRKGLPYGTGIVDLIFSSHMFEHLTYAEGLSLLRECRRVIRPSGGMRLIVPDANLLMSKYKLNELAAFDEVNGNCANAPTSAGKLWSLLHDGHQACYDGETLCKLLGDAGWKSTVSSFREAKYPDQMGQILKETVEMSYGFSLFVDAIPDV